MYIPWFRSVSATECYDPGTIENGVSQGNAPFMCHSRVTFSCNEGFLMSGESSMTCTENGLWNAEKPKCITKGKQLICVFTLLSMIGKQV